MVILRARRRRGETRKPPVLPMVGSGEGKSGWGETL